MTKLGQVAITGFKIPSFFSFEYITRSFAEFDIPSFSIFKIFIIVYIDTGPFHIYSVDASLSNFNQLGSNSIFIWQLLLLLINANLSQDFKSGWIHSYGCFRFLKLPLSTSIFSIIGYSCSLYQVLLYLSPKLLASRSRI